MGRKTEQKTENKTEHKTAQKTAYHLSLEQARGYLIHYHFLDGKSELLGDDGILRFFERVNCIQYDPLNIVGRNADLVLQSRIKGYQATMLHGLLYEKRQLLDGWDKMMSIYRMTDWPFFQRVRDDMKEQITWVLSNRNSLEALELIPEVEKIIIEKGPIQAKDIKIGSSSVQTWGHKKMSSATLDYMYHVGMIGVATKRNTQKVYDRIEALVPSELLSMKEPFEDDNAFDRWYVKRRIAGIGMLWTRSGGGWLGYHLSDIPRRKQVIEELETAGEIIPVWVESIKECFYIRKEDVELMDGFLESYAKESNETLQPSKIRILAPLDNLIWDRDMVEKIFGFKYMWEVYVPEKKRKYGYYVLPVLYKDRFIARFEPELYRKGESLKIKQWWWEESLNESINKSIDESVNESVNKSVKQSPEILQAIEDGLMEFCDYLGAKGYELPLLNFNK